ncbi:MAG: hypothetical protein ACE5G1_16180 [bacterium]
MPPVELSAREIRLLSYYVAGLHRAKNPTVSKADADATCPVCYSPVSIAQARASKLYAKFLGKRYYFECQDCAATFRKAPEAFLKLMEMDGVEPVKKAAP